LACLPLTPMKSYHNNQPMNPVICFDFLTVKEISLISTSSRDLDRQR
jgi:hypothetical protein